MGPISVDGRLAVVRDAAVVAAVAASVFFLAYADGGFNATTRAYAAIIGWWLLGAGAALGLGPALSRTSRLAVAAPCFLALFGLWALLSINWAPDAGRAFDEFNQISLYVAVLALGIVLARRIPASLLVGGVALALSAVAVVAFVSRCFPSSFGVQPGQKELAELGPRLSFPLGYWNGLAIATALAYPLLLATMASRRSRIASAVACLPLPVIAADMYLASSRGAYVTAAVAVVVYLALSAHRWTGLAATAVAGVAAAVAVEYLVPRKALVSGRMYTSLGVSQGHHAALVVGVTAVGGAVVWLGVAELARRVPSPRAWIGWATAGLLVLVVVAAAVAAHPIRRFDLFKSNTTSYSGSKTLIENHLLSSSGSGRWQLWTAAVQQFRAHPLNGGGAGSWETWWLQHEAIPLFSQFAHSLYLETMGELGIVGLLLLAAAVLTAVAGAVRSSLVLRSTEVAGAAACGIAFFAAASFDWIWQLAGIAVVGVGMLGVALGALPSGRPERSSRFGVVRPLLALVAVAAIVPQVVGLAAGIHLRNSQSAAAAGNSSRARSEALAMKAVEPWASGPYLQLALIDEQELRYSAAKSEIQSSIARAKQDWTLWLVALQIDVHRGAIADARTDLAEVKTLYPGFTIAGSSG